ncbi:hypothetical protein [Nesterenkonia marinintestina]|uniref:hypothetical protein n=1 Tax=Nesterenkonia marinintestina TaxID=2979865 RepID=UPI0021C0BEF9|nr:hypothetical protein [Nesterenkonia sp. GX14115]
MGRRGGAGGSKWRRPHRPLNPGLIDGGVVGGSRQRRADGEYHVRAISGAAAVKSYVCPGCGLSIAPGTAHLVAWRADSLFGDEHAASERRHWHRRCWQIP